MPATLPKLALYEANAAVQFAQQTRRLHAKRSNKRSPQRKQDIDRALARLASAMAPLRSEIGRFPYGPQTDQAEDNREIIRDASQAIQRERRKLQKMRKLKRRKAKPS